MADVSDDLQQFRCAFCNKRARLFKFLRMTKGHPTYQALCLGHKKSALGKGVARCRCGPVFFPGKYLDPVTKVCVFCEDE